MMKYFDHNVTQPGLVAQLVERRCSNQEVRGFKSRRVKDFSFILVLISKRKRKRQTGLKPVFLVVSKFNSSRVGDGAKLLLAVVPRPLVRQQPLLVGNTTYAN